MTGAALLLPLASAILAAVGALEASFEAVLLSTRIAIDEGNRLILAAVAFLWVVAVFRQAAEGWRDGRYRLSFLLTQAGSLGAVVTIDPVGYYAWFSLMTLASYGLVDVGPRTRWAAGLYLGAALIGEMLLLAGLMMAGVAQAHPLAAWLVILGLGAKLGIPPFHVALPPAYEAAPPAGAAVLGGMLTAVAATGWLRFLPPVAAEDLTEPVVAVGLLAAFLGAALGVFQRRGRALLGYSTISQMGLLTVGAGMAMAAGWPIAGPVLMVFLLHHSLAKSALLLGLDESGTALGRPVWIALALLSLSLAGFPGTGGTLAKGGLEELADRPVLAFLLPLTSVATAALMARFLILVRHRGAPDPTGGAWPTLLCAAAALLLPWLLADQAHLAKAWSPAKVVAHVWPVLLGAAIAVLQWRFLRGASLPAGDLAAWAWEAIRAKHPVRPRRQVPAAAFDPWARPAAALDAAERWLRSTAALSLLFAVTSGGLLFLLAAG